MPLLHGELSYMHQRNARIGRYLFGIYTLFYGGFVLLNAYSPDTMERTPLAGINLAILYGFGLIALAVVLALLYGWLCQRTAPEADRGEDLA